MELSFLKSLERRMITFAEFLLDWKRLDMGCSG